MTFDEKCFDLAEYFLEGEPDMATDRNKRRLAAEIQATIEDWIGYERTDPLPDTNGSPPAPSLRDEGEKGK